MYDLLDAEISDSLKTFVKSMTLTLLLLSYTICTVTVHVISYTIHIDTCKIYGANISCTDTVKVMLL